MPHSSPLSARAVLERSSLSWSRCGRLFHRSHWPKMIAIAALSGMAFAGISASRQASHDYEEARRAISSLEGYLLHYRDKHLAWPPALQPLTQPFNTEQAPHVASIELQPAGHLIVNFKKDAAWINRRHPLDFGPERHGLSIAWQCTSINAVQSALLPDCDHE